MRRKGLMTPRERDRIYDDARMQLYTIIAVAWIMLAFIVFVIPWIAAAPSPREIVETVKKSLPACVDTRGNR